MSLLKILYLASAEKKRNFYWKVGLKNFQPNIRLEKGCCLECFRKEILVEKSAKEILYAININIRNLVRSCEEDGYALTKPLTGFSYDIPLEVLEEIFDFWVYINKQPEQWNKCLGLLNCRREIPLKKAIFRKAFKGFTSEIIEQIEYLHSYRPILIRNLERKKIPMW